MKWKTSNRLADIILTMVILCPECNSSMTTQPFACFNCSFTPSQDEFGVIHMTSNNRGGSNYTSSDFLSAFRELNYPFQIKQLQKLEERYSGYNIRSTVDTSRFDWLSLDSFADQTVIDIGCQFIGSSIYAANRDAKVVYTIGENITRLRFLAEWANKAGLENVYPIHAKITEVEFSSVMGDICLVIGSLKQIGECGDEESPLQIQRKTLTMIANSLPPDGTLLTAVENRYSLDHFLGRTSHSAEPPFAPLLHRAAASVFSKLINGHRYERYSYSKTGYKKLFQQSGFSDCFVYIPIPDYRDPQVFYQDKQGALSKVLQEFTLSLPESIAKHVLIQADRFGKGDLFVPSYVIRCQK